MSANNSSVVNAMSINSSAATVTPPLLRLPAELIEMVAQAVEKPADLLSFRSACRDLRNDSSRAYCKRFFSKEAEISGTGSSNRELADTLLSPNLPGAKHVARSLKTTVPLVRPTWPIDVNYLREALMPSPEDIARLFAAMPKLDDIYFEDSKSEDPSWKVSAVRSAPLLLRGLATPGLHLPHLRRMRLLQICVDGDVLASVLKAHAHSLEEVFLVMVRITGTSTSWIEILETLHSTNVSYFMLYYLEAEGEGGSTMRVRFPDELCKELQHPHYEEEASESGIESKRVKPVLEVTLRTLKSAEWLEEGTWR